MKRVIALIYIVLFLFAPVKSASAHLVGQPPFFRINGVYSNLYPVPTSSLQNFNLPQDLGAENYLVNQQLEFLMETEQLPVLPEIVARTKFDWDWGDGSAHSIGLKNNHTYKKMGSFFMSITAKVDSDEPQIIQSTLINIVPDKNYQLPKAVIKVNGLKSKDPLTDIIHENFSKELIMDGSESSGGSSKIVSYFWDFGDVTSSDQQITKHSYAQDQSQVFPVLRVKDANGFMTDSFLEIENGSETTGIFDNSNDSVKKISGSVNPWLIGGGVLAIGVLLFMARRFFQGRRRGGRL